MPLKRTLSSKVWLVTGISALIQFGFIVRIAYLYQALHSELELSAITLGLSGPVSTIANLWSEVGSVFPRSIASPEVAATRLSEFIRLLQREFSNVGALVPKDTKERLTITKIQDDLRKANLLVDQAEEGGGDRRHVSESLQQIAAIAEAGAADSRQLLKEFTETQFAHQERADELSWSLNVTLCLLIVVNIETAVLVAFLFIAGITGKVELLSQNFKRISNNIPLHEPLKGDDELVELDETIRQMSASLAEVERKERAVVDNARDLIFSLDGELLFESTNPAARLILGYSPEELIGRKFVDLVVPDERDLVADWLKTTATSTKTQRFECRMLAQNGGLTDILLSAYWSKADQKYSCTGHDMTETRSLERMKRQFVAMISHDLRTPLSSILSMLTAIESRVYEAKSEKGAERVHSAIENVDRMLRLTDDLLEMGTFQTASLSVELKTIAISSVINESLASVQTFAEHRGVSISAADIVDCTIEGDRTRLVQVLVNLLSNAVKFSPFNSTVRIKCDRSSDRLKIEVIDSGPGISKEDQAIIFEPYRQSSDSETGKHREGTGLGLAICKLIVDAHNGSIGVTSAEPKGSIFWIEIPLPVQSELE